MKTSRLFGSVLLLALCLAASAPADDPPPDPGAGGIGGGGAVNSITIAVVNTDTKGVVNLGGAYTTQAAGVTLDVIDGYAYPTAGGKVAKGGGAKSGVTITPNKNGTGGTWQSVFVTGLTKRGYSVRVEGTFSVGPKVASPYATASPNGDNPAPSGLTIVWDPGYPKYTVGSGMKISSRGTYTGNPGMFGGIVATPWAGGVIPTGTATATNAVNQTWTAPDVAAGASGMFVVFAVINGADGETYCSEYKTVFVGGN